MQNTATPRLNRIPRHLPTRPSLYRRLCRWVQMRTVRTRITQLQQARANLQHGMALDEAAALVHQINYTKSPVLRQRMDEDHASLQALEAELLDAQLALAELECGA